MSHIHLYGIPKGAECDSPSAVVFAEQLLGHLDTMKRHG